MQRLGGARRTPVDVRLMAATNRNLPIEVNERRFRADLYYRLAVVVVTLPPLREHLEDVPDLVDHFLEVMGAKDHPRAAALKTPSFLAEIARHRWPGNIRELRNHVERRLALEDPLPLPEATSSTPATIDVSQPLRAARERWLLSFERRYLEELLRAHGNNVRAAAQAAGMNRTHLYRLMTRCGLR